MIFIVVAGYLKYRVNDRQAIHDIKIPVVEVPVLDGERLWSLVLENQILNVTILPGGNYLSKCQKSHITNCQIKDGYNAWEEAFTNPAFYLWISMFPINDINCS